MLIPSALSLSLGLAVAAPATPDPPAAPAPAAPAADVVPAPAARKALRIAVYDLQLDGVDERVGHVVTDALVDELRKLQKVSVVSMVEVRAMLDVEAQKQLVGCSDA